MSIPAFNAVSVEAKSQLISAENLAVGYRDLVVWREANFTIEQGEFVAVIGPNGAGRSNSLPPAPRSSTSDCR